MPKLGIYVPLLSQLRWQAHQAGDRCREAIPPVSGHILPGKLVSRRSQVCSFLRGLHSNPPVKAIASSKRVLQRRSTQAGQMKSYNNYKLQNNVMQSCKSQSRDGLFVGSPRSLLVAYVYRFPLKLRGLQSASELHRPSDRRLSAKLVPTFAGRGCRVVSATVPPAVSLGFLDRSRYFSIQAAPKLTSRG
jgi:hypothetical protein